LNCKCGGKLRRIAVDCYECSICGLKQEIAFISIQPKSNINIEIQPINIENYNKQLNIEKIIDQINDQISKNIFKQLGIPKRYLNNES